MGQTIVGFLLQLFVFLELFLHSYKLLLIIDAIVNTFVAILLLILAQSCIIGHC